MPPSGKTALIERIVEKISDSPGSSLPFAAFMELVLYDPDSGYYASNSDQRVGRDGDFFTSVSVGECFGKLLAAHFLSADPTLHQVVEQGANDGQLARDLLTHLPPGIDYIIVEPFPAMRELQRQELAGQTGIRWVESLDQIDGGITGRFVCNELLDAFPVERVRRRAAGWTQIHIDRQFEEIEVEITDPQLAAEVSAVLGQRDLPEGYTTEIHLRANEWITQMLDHLRPGSAATVIDYGHEADDYYSVERRDGTLRGFRDHKQVTDLFAEIGETDLTASVNFTRLAEFAGRSTVIDQHHFLIEAARPWLAEIESRGEAPDEQTQALLRQFNTLIHPGLMGRSFKVLEITAA